MKFGRSLPRNQVPEWASSYINYKGLKKLIKNAEQGTTPDGKSDLAGFLHSLDRNLEDVDQFYNKKYQDVSRQMKLLEDRYGSSLEGAREVDVDDREDLLATLLDLRGQLRKLQWYGEVNRRGFVKITKKLDKKIPAAQAQKKYLLLKVEPTAFATNAPVFESMPKINSWISVLGETATTTTSTADKPGTSATKLQKTSSQPAFELPSQYVSALEQSLQSDNVEEFEKVLGRVKEAFTPRVSETIFQRFLKTILHKAIAGRHRACTGALLNQIVYLDDHDDINRRNCIHRLVVSIGRSQSSSDAEAAAEPAPDIEAELSNFIAPATTPSKQFKRSVLKEDKHSQILGREDPPILFLGFLLDSLQSSQRPGLLARDSAGRTPLHFAAEYGIRVMCEIIIEHLLAWNLFDVRTGIDGPSWQDNEGWAPLHLSVIGGHPLTTKALLDAESRQYARSHDEPFRHTSAKSAAVLALATKSNYVEIVRILVNAGVNLNYRDEQGETALHIAARFGHADCARLLLAGSETQKADTEVCENTYGWTPLFIACVDGHMPIVELLVDAEADVDKVDSSGWTAKEHAALRGHIDIAQRLAEITNEIDAESTNSNGSNSPPTSTSLTDRTSTSITMNNGFGNGSNGNTMKNLEPVKSFGHRYLVDKSMILVTLGTMDMRKTISAVSLDQIPLSDAHSTQLDTALSIIVSAKGAEGEAEMIDLPVQGNLATEPIIFHATDPTRVKILFDLVPTYSGTQDKVLGRGVALLASVKPNIGSKRMALQGDVTVPILSATDLEVIGSVTFNFLIITPFEHPNMSITENQTYWKSITSTMVIGHRGLGKNMAGRHSLQLGENTIQSFIAAANLGASYVEFDVQLTKDLVPVIYHDFLVSETGIDAPVHTLTLEQFLSAGDSRTPRASRPASPSPHDGPKRSAAKTVDPRAAPRIRSHSLGGLYDSEPLDVDERIKHTRDFKMKGFKGNSRGKHIQAPFATLEEMFRKVPNNVGFNIEMKYPMLFESEDEEMDTYAVELNSFVDTVLKKVYDLGKGRNILFSSFNPDICLLLSFKQPSIPVMFLTDAGTSPVGDIRASSLQEAIRFASRWNLLGVVAAAQPLVYAPRLVRVVKESGLVCVSYGQMNNDSDKVKLQVKQGIDAVIVDSVLAIRRGLTGDHKVKKFNKPSTVALTASGSATPNHKNGLGTSPGTDSYLKPSTTVIAQLGLAKMINGSTDSLDVPRVTAEPQEMGSPSSEENLDNITTLDTGKTMLKLPQSTSTSGPVPIQNTNSKLAAT